MTPQRIAGLLLAGAALAGSLSSAGAVQAGSAVQAGRSSPAASEAAGLPTIHVLATSKGVSVTGPRRFHAGRVAFVLHAAASTGEDGGYLGLFHFVDHYNPKDFLRDQTYYYSHGGGDYRPTKRALAVLRRADRHTHPYGGLACGPKRTQTETVTLSHGTYYLTADDQNFIKLVSVGASVKRAAPASSATVKALSHHQFGGADVLPRHGTIGFANHAAAAQGLELRQIKRSTSRATVTHRYAHLSHERSGQPPSWFLSGNLLTAAIEPGHSQTLKYSLPAGKYLELGYVTDDRTGNEFAYEGMWRIVEVR